MQRTIPTIQGAAMLAFVAAIATATGADAQPFTRITDPTNPIVTSLPPPGSGSAPCWVDVDSDGLDDLWLGNIAIFRNLGGGTFVRFDVLNNVGGNGCSWADYDNDGDPDLMMAGTQNAGRGSRLWRNDGGFQFAQVTSGDIGDSLSNTGWSCAWGDYDADGFVDLVIASANNFSGFTPNRLFHNRGDGTLESVFDTDVTSPVAPYTIPTWSDWDLDGDLDLSIGAGPANGSRANDYFYRNTRREGGTQILDRIIVAPLGTDPRDGQVVNWIDYDNDGDVDCFITNFFSMENSLYRNDAGTYVRMTSAVAGDIADETAAFNLSNMWEDFDNDGDLDCYVTRTGGTISRFYRNDGGGNFRSLDFGLMTNSIAATSTAYDWDQDGDVDVFIGGPPTVRGLYRNELDPGNHWVQLRLRGVVSNRSAIGARIHLTARIGGVRVTQRREVSAQNVFNGHSSFVQHFGLGDATSIDTVRVVWPNGDVQVIRDLPVDVRMNLIEGQIPTPTAVADAMTRITRDGVAIEWRGAGLAERMGVQVERRGRRGAWTAIGAPLATGPDRLTFVDRSAVSGEWAYRLRAGEWSTSETWVQLPDERLAMRMLGSSSGSMRVELSLPRAGAVTLDVFDAGGRRVASPELGSLEAGRHERSVDTRSLRTGIYWLRLRQEEHDVTARAIVSR